MVFFVLFFVFDWNKVNSSALDHNTLKKRGIPLITLYEQIVDDILLNNLKSPLGHEKRKPRFAGVIDPIFPNWETFCSLVCWNHVKSTLFGQILLNFGWKFLESNWEYFSEIFLQKTSDFLKIFVFFRGVIFTTRKKKNIKKKMSPLTDPTWNVRPPVKQDFFFFVALPSTMYHLPSWFHALSWKKKVSGNFDHCYWPLLDLSLVNRPVYLTCGRSNSGQSH